MTLVPADAWEELEHAMRELMAVPDADEPLSLAEWEQAYRSEHRQRYGFEPGEAQVKVAVTAERLTREWPPLSTRSRPELSLIQGGRDDAR